MPQATKNFSDMVYPWIFIGLSSSFRNTDVLPKLLKYLPPFAYLFSLT